MNKKLRKYLSQLIGRSSLVRLIGASSGSLLGFFILMAAFQLYSDVNWFINNDEDDLFGPGMLVINKKVQVANIAGFSDNHFSAKEIREINAKPFVQRVEPFVPCNYKVAVQISISGYNIPNFVSEFFFESIPDNLVEIDEKIWKWDQDSPEVPVVLPADFLRFYNFGFAPGQNLPPLSEKAIRIARLHITIRGNNEIYHVGGRIAGLSERINTILVPESFMGYTNNRFGNQKKMKPSRLVLVSKVTADPKLTNYIRKKGYEANESELRSGKLNQLLQISVVVTGVIGFVIVLLAFYLFILSFSLFIVKANYEIRTLIQLGIAPVKIERYVFKTLMFISIIILSVDALLIYFSHKIVLKSFEAKGIGLMPYTDPTTFLYAGGVMSIMLLLNYFNIRKNINKLT